MSEPTCRALCYSGAGCLSGVRTYLPGTVYTEVQTVEAVSEPTYRALCYSGAGFLSGVRTYLPGTMLQWCRLFKGCRNLPAGHCVTWCRLFKRCRNLPAGHCVTVVKAVLAMSESTCWALCYSDTDCLRSVGT